jgi:hypothetical protein
VSQVEFKHTLEGFQRFDDERCKLGVPASECLVAIETAYNLLVDFDIVSYVIFLLRKRGKVRHLNHADAFS